MRIVGLRAPATQERLQGTTPPKIVRPPRVGTGARQLDLYAADHLRERELLAELLSAELAGYRQGEQTDGGASNRSAMPSHDFPLRGRSIAVVRPTPGERSECNGVRMRWER